MERVEKWITRKIPVEKQTKYIYAVRWGGVLVTCKSFFLFFLNKMEFLGAVAELVPHLALFISLLGAFSGASMALLFPPCIEMLVSRKD